MINLDKNFERYTDFDTKVPVWCITPNTHAILRFFDTSPISPSGRYVALTKLGSETELPKPGDIAEILLVDLETGQTNTIAETRGWDTQLGAQVQWGSDDTALFYNDVDIKSWEPYGVKLNPFTLKKKKLDGTIYMVSPDGNYALSTCLKRIGLTQPGYGVIVPKSFVPTNIGADKNDYIYITDTNTGERKELISIYDVVENSIPKIDISKYGKGDFYGFHLKWSPDGKKIMYVLRYKAGEKKHYFLITMDKDGTNIKTAIPSSLWSDRNGGHHPDWHPDSKRVIMNVMEYKDGPLRFMEVDYDGTNFKLISDKVYGSGHPSVHKDGKYIITDVYLNTVCAYGDGTTPIRLYNIEKDTVEDIIRIRTKPISSLEELRVDPHPVWDKTFTKIAFNACPDGSRKVFIADLTGKLI
jgi:Tol biopolymer transport system component